jgi:hypothetical protein
LLNQANPGRVLANYSDAYKVVVLTMYPEALQQHMLEECLIQVFLMASGKPFGYVFDILDFQQHDEPLFSAVILADLLSIMHSLVPSMPKTTSQWAGKSQHILKLASLATTWTCNFVNSDNIYVL